MSEEKLQKELEAYQDLIQQGQKVDIAALAISALDKNEQNLIPVKEKRWAYIIALGVPPLGLLFAVKFYLSNKDDGEQSAWLCVALTVVSIMLAVLLFKLLLGGSGANVNQIRQIRPEDIQQLIE